MTETETQAYRTLESLVRFYGNEAIPAMLSAIVLMTVNAGAVDAIKAMLTGMIPLADEINEMRVKVGN